MVSKGKEKAKQQARKAGIGSDSIVNIPRPLKRKRTKTKQISSGEDSEYGDDEAEQNANAAKRRRVRTMAKKKATGERIPKKKGTTILKIGRAHV